MSHPPFHGWKTRLFHLSHSPLVLAQVTVGILLSGFLIACAIVAVRGQDDISRDPATQLTRRFQQRLDKIASSRENHPRLLVGWIYAVTTKRTDAVKKTKTSLPEIKPLAQPVATPVWMGFKLKDIVHRHITDPALRSRFDDYVLARTDAETPEGQAARNRLETAAQTTPAPAFASEFMGDLLIDDGKPVEAMKAYQVEGEFPDAGRARRRAFHIALDEKDQGTLREMLTSPLYKDATPSDLHRAAVFLGDWGLAATSFLRMETQHVRPDQLIFTLLAGALWYAVFVRFGVRDRWRWIQPFPAVLAGIASIWPTMILIHWQDLHVGQEETGEFLHDLIFYVTGVGLREEGSKLALFALFIPWLLKHRSPGKALLTGAFVGLGFAIDENRGYFQADGTATAAVGRMLTANFFHAAATGLTGQALYELARTRFGSAERFIATFVGVVVVHGVYDWVLGAGSSLAVIGNVTMISMVIIALLAQQFFDRLSVLMNPQRGLVSLLSMFLVGLSVLVAAGFILAAVQTGTLAAVSAVGIEALSLVPITVLYARKFEHL